MKVSAFSSATSPVAERVFDGAWSAFVAQLHSPSPATTPKIELPLWSPAEFQDCHRAKQSVLAVHALTLDIDKTPVPSRREIEAAFAGTQAVVHSSSSATATSPRWRGVLALSRPVTGGEYYRLWSAFTQKLPFVVGTEAKDPSRAWFVPRVGADGYFESFEVEGTPLDVDAWLALAPDEREADALAAPVEMLDPDERAYRRELYTAYLRDAQPCIQGQGGDVRLFEVVQHGSYDLSLPTSDVLDLVREHFDPRCEPPWGDDLEERVLHKARTPCSRPRMEPWPRELADFMSSVTTAKAKPVVPEDVPFRIDWGGWTAPISPPEYLVAGLLPAGKVILIVAEGGSLKSWTVDDIAISVATGKPWLGRYVVEQGRVLIADFEDGSYEKKRRHKILNPSSIDIPDLGYTYCPADLDDTPFWTGLAGLSLKLLVIDSLSAGASASVDENTSQMANVVKLAGRFTEASPGTTVVIVHHANKSGGIRGFSGIRDQADCAFKFEPVSETDNVKRMRLVCDKPGPQRKPAPVNVELSDAGLRWFDDETQAAGRNASDERSVRSAIMLALANHEVSGYRELARVTGLPEKVARKELAILEERGDVVRGARKRILPGDDKSQRSRVQACLSAAEGSEAFRSFDALSKAAGVSRETLERMYMARDLYWSSTSRDSDARYLILRDAS